MMRKNTTFCATRNGTFAAIVFLCIFTSTATAKSILEYQTLFQEKLLSVAVSLVFFFIIHHMICSRMSDDRSTTGEGGEKKE